MRNVILRYNVEFRCTIDSSGAWQTCVHACVIACVYICEYERWYMCIMCVCRISPGNEVIFVYQFAFNDPASRSPFKDTQAIGKCGLCQQTRYFFLSMREWMSRTYYWPRLWRVTLQKSWIIIIILTIFINGAFIT